jgi:hypothetical protein
MLWSEIPDDAEEQFMRGKISMGRADEDGVGDNRIVTPSRDYHGIRIGFDRAEITLAIDALKAD